MTKGLEKPSNRKLKLYKVILKSDHTEEDVTKYKAHRNIYNALKKTTRKNANRINKIQKSSGD